MLCSLLYLVSGCNFEYDLGGLLVVYLPPHSEYASGGGVVEVESGCRIVCVPIRVGDPAKISGVN